MIHFKSFPIIFILVITSFCSLEVSAQTDNLNVIHEEKLSLSFGLGHEYSVLGFRLNYSIFDNLDLVAGFSPFGLAIDGQLGESFAKAGIQYNFSRPISTQRIVPYLNLLYGVGNHVKMTDEGRIFWAEIPDHSFFNKTFFGATVGVGAKFKLFKKGRSYGNIGFQYVVIDTDSRTRYFNEQKRYGLTRSFIVADYSLSLGYTFVLNSRTPATKN